MQFFREEDIASLSVACKAYREVGDAFSIHPIVSNTRTDGMTFVRLPHSVKVQIFDKV